MKRIFNYDTQTLVGRFEESEKQAVIEKYEALGYEVNEDHDGELVIGSPDEEN